MGLMNLFENYMNNRIDKQEQIGKIDSEKATKTRDSLNYFIGNVKSLQENMKSKEQKDLELIQSGDLPVVQANGIILKGNELCHLYLPASRIEIKNETIGSEGGIGGVSLKVTNGITLHSGSTARHAIKKDVEHQYSGMLAITNKRILFVANEGKNITIQLNSLIGYKRGATEFSFSKEDKTEKFTLNNTKVPEMIEAILKAVM